MGASGHRMGASGLPKREHTFGHRASVASPKPFFPIQESSTLPSDQHDTHGAAHIAELSRQRRLSVTPAQVARTRMDDHNRGACPRLLPPYLTDYITARRSFCGRPRASAARQPRRPRRASANHEPRKQRSRVPCVSSRSLGTVFHSVARAGFLRYREMRLACCIPRRSIALRSHGAACIVAAPRPLHRPLHSFVSSCGRGHRAAVAEAERQPSDARRRGGLRADAA